MVLVAGPVLVVVDGLVVTGTLVEVGAEVEAEEHADRTSPSTSRAGNPLRM